MQASLRSQAMHISRVSCTNTTNRFQIKQTILEQMNINTSFISGIMAGKED